MLIASMVAILMASCTEKETITTDDIASDDAVYKTSIVDIDTAQTDTTCVGGFPPEPISEAEEAALRLMREEELLARDIYDAFFVLYEYPIFDFISNSENWHASVVGFLLDKYDLEDPAVNHVPGVFDNEELQTLYEQLIDQGSVSGTEALLVGATIEDLDIVDLQNYIDNDIDNADITCAFLNLMKGSRNHLRSFTRLLGYNDVTYEPQFLSQEIYDEIINSPHEFGPVDCSGL